MSFALAVPRSAATGSRAKLEAAKDMEAAVRERAERKGVEPPPYEFLELIGKGSFGRVYKSKNRNTQEIVAVKVVEIDRADYAAHMMDKDATIKDTMHEIDVLTRLKETGAENINLIKDAFEFHTQFWIVTEYCPGGSVHTLMKACYVPGLDEEYIIPIARELAKALKSVHAAGIVHRDIKCSNVFITEDGRLQLGDFGIAGVLETNASKRSTVLGTPNWMPPEMVDHLFSDSGESAVRYGTEVDCWSYGCVIYEMASGFAPYLRIHPMDLHKYIRTTPLSLDSTRFSRDLQEFVAFCLKENPAERPTAQQILDHPYLAGSEETHPVSKLQELLGLYFMWEQSGGHRASLFTPNGAAGPEDFTSQEHDEDEWNFSLTQEFEKRVSVAFGDDEPFDSKAADLSTPTMPRKPMTGRDKRIREARIQRGGQLQNIFNPPGMTHKGHGGRAHTTSNTPYGSTDDSRRMSDLPLRNLSSDRAADRTTMIDLDAAEVDSAPSIDLDVPTLRANRFRNALRDYSDDEDETNYTARRDRDRDTMDWKFPMSTDPELPRVKKDRTTMQWSFEAALADLGDEEPDTAAPKRDTMAFKFPMSDPAGEDPLETSEMFWTRPALKHAATMPADFSNRSPRESLIDLDMAIPEFESSTRPSTSGTDSALTDVSRGDPFDLEDSAPTEDTSLQGISNDLNAMHLKSRSEPLQKPTTPSFPPQPRSRAATAMRREPDYLARGYIPSKQNAPFQSQFNIWKIGEGARRDSEDGDRKYFMRADFPEPEMPHKAALGTGDVSHGFMEAELSRIMRGFIDTARMAERAFNAYDEFMEEKQDQN